MKTNLKLTKIILFILFSLLFSNCTDSQNIESMIEKGDLIFAPNNANPYSGKIFKLHNNGKKKYEGFILNGYRNGEFKYYTESGSLEKIETYAKGLLNGESVFYDGNGEIHNNYLNERLEGAQTSFNRSGLKTYEGQFHLGNEIGVHKYWFDNKKPCAIVSYVSNNDNDDTHLDLENCKLFYPNGNKRCEFKIDYNENALYRLEYSEDGKVEKTLKYSLADVNASFDGGGGNKYHMKGEFHLGYYAKLIK